MKRKIRRTGEIIDVITFSSSTTRSDHDRIQFYGDNGSVISESLNFISIPFLWMMKTKM